MLRQLRARAALEGTTLKRLVAELIERGLAQASPAPRKATRAKLPTIALGKPLGIRNPSNAALFELLDG